MFRNGSYFACHNLFVQHIHGLCQKRWAQCGHLVDDTAKRPHIAFIIIRAIFPYFRACIERCSNLSKVAFPILLIQLGDVQISNLEVPIFNKNILWLYIAMKYGPIVKIADAMNKSDQCLPNLNLKKFLFFIFFSLNEVCKISLICILHHDTQ